MANGTAGCDFGQLLYDQVQEDRRANGLRYDDIRESVGSVKDTLARMDARDKMSRRIVLWVLGSGGLLGLIAGIRALVDFLSALAAQ